MSSKDHDIRYVKKSHLIALLDFALKQNTKVEENEDNSREEEDGGEEATGEAEHKVE